MRSGIARIMREVCKDVRVEPALLPTSPEALRGNTADGARLDVSARGVWSGYEKTFVDIRVTHPTADSNMTKNLDAVYRDNEREKKNAYLRWIVEVEKASFTPLVFTTTGGMGPECERFNRRLAELIAVKKGERYSDVIGHIRRSLRFALLRATLVAVRGMRGKQSVETGEEFGAVSFNLVPQCQAYEG